MKICSWQAIGGVEGENESSVRGFPQRNLCDRRFAGADSLSAGTGISVATALTVLEIA